MKTYNETAYYAHAHQQSKTRDIAESEKRFAQQPRGVAEAAGSEMTDQREERRSHAKYQASRNQ